MAVHSLHIFDRKGKTLFTKRYIKDTASSSSSSVDPTDEELQRSEQRKLVFGMLFSLREVVASLSPPQSAANTDASNSGSLQSVQTAASTLFHLESNSGIRLALYVTNSGDSSSGMGSHAATGTSSGGAATSTGSGGNASVAGAGSAQQQHSAIRAALHHIYHQLWMECVVRSPLYRPAQPNVAATNFESSLDAYLAQQPWFR